MLNNKFLSRLGCVICVLLLSYTVINIIGKQSFCLLKNASVIYKYASEVNTESTAADSIISLYMPLWGYAASYYVDDSFLTDPSYIKTGYDNESEDKSEYGGTFDAQGENPAEGEGVPAVNSEEKADTSDSSTTTASTSVASGELTSTSLSFSELTSTSLTSASLTSSITGVKLDKSELSSLSYLIDNIYTVTSITELTENKFDVSLALEEDFTIVQDSTAPQILIFHTHSQEGFADSVALDAGTTIVGVGARLAEILSVEYGYSVIHDTSVYDYVNGVLDRSKAYTYAEEGVKKILEAYPSVEVVLDIHRDGVDDSVRLVTDIDGRPTARFMLFNGISYTKVNGDIQYLDNPYIQDNLAMSLQMYLLGRVYYPGLLRNNYINGYRYCLHLRAKSMLIEVGAQNNTLEEELNAMIPLANLLNRLLTGEKGYE